MFRFPGIFWSSCCNYRPLCDGCAQSMKHSANAVQTPAHLFRQTLCSVHGFQVGSLAYASGHACGRTGKPFEQNALHAAPPLSARIRKQTKCHLRHDSPSRAILSLDNTRGAARASDRMLGKTPASSLIVQQRSPHACTEPCSLLPHASIPEPVSALAGSTAALPQARPGSFYSVAVHARHKQMP